ncbi:MAG: hypothetical protein RIC52_04305, partial [Amphiplicatus sp.]
WKLIGEPMKGQRRGQTDDCFRRPLSDFGEAGVEFDIGSRQLINASSDPDDIAIVYGAGYGGRADPDLAEIA